MNYTVVIQYRQDPEPVYYLIQAKNKTEARRIIRKELRISKSTGKILAIDPHTRRNPMRETGGGRFQMGNNDHQTALFTGTVDPRWAVQLQGQNNEHLLFRGGAGRGRYTADDWKSFLKNVKENGFVPKNSGSFIIVEFGKNGKKTRDIDNKVSREMYRRHSREWDYPMDEAAQLVDPDTDIIATIYEGNHRARIAYQLGIPLPLEMKFFGGSETFLEKASPNSPLGIVRRMIAETGAIPNPSWKKKRPTTNLTRLKPNQKVIMYHGTTLTDAQEMINGFDTNTMVRSHFHSRGYRYRGLYVSPEPLHQFGYVILKLALRTNNLHGTDYSANITRPSDPQYDAKEATHRKKWSKEMYPHSFRPDLSRTLLQSTEPQALYRGIVSSDMILGVKVRGKDWMTREEFMEAYDVDETEDGFDITSPNYTVDEYLDYIGGGSSEREMVIRTIQRNMRYDRDPDRRNDNVERLMNQLGLGVSAQRAFLRKFKRKYGAG